MEYAKNTNALEGFGCPECGNEDDFHIWVSGLAHMTDEGVHYITDTEWDMNSYCICDGCDKEGTVDDFQHL